MRALGIALILAVWSSLSLATEILCDDKEENLKVYLDMTRILFNERDHTRAAEFYADEFISHNTDGGGLGTTVRNPEHMQRIWINSKRVSPDRVLKNNLIVCNGDVVVARVTMKGTRVVGPMKGNPPNGRSFETSAIDIYRFKDGKVVERWGNNDSIAMIRQLGLQVDLSMTPLKK